MGAENLKRFTFDRQAISGQLERWKLSSRSAILKRRCFPLRFQLSSHSKEQFGIDEIRPCTNLHRCTHRRKLQSPSTGLPSESRHKAGASEISRDTTEGEFSCLQRAMADKIAPMNPYSICFPRELSKKSDECS